MFAEQGAQEVGVEAVGIVQGVGSGVLGDHAEVDGCVAEREAEVNQESAYFGFLSERNGKIGSDGGDSAPPLGA